MTKSQGYLVLAALCLIISELSKDSSIRTVAAITGVIAAAVGLFFVGEQQ